MYMYKFIYIYICIYVFITIHHLFNPSQILVTL